MRETSRDERVLHHMTDRQLIRAYAGTQDCRAFGVFVGRHEGALLSFAAAVLRDDSLAQDVVQETFLRVARNPQRVLGLNAGATSERNWLLKVVRDLSVDSLRRRAGERRAVGTLAAGAEKTAPPADAQAERREDADGVRAAVDRLQPRLRELLILKVREQKSYKEIAQITGLSVTNVGFLLHQAMQELARWLQATHGQ
ncbi:MAG: RNA polymerase sigma factor [Planctomycetota bacterium]|nr:RNA polymerase sigma factor [Planctomycetota bacterium]